jgi:VWFA-related protein
MKGSAKAVFFRAFLCSTCLWLAWTICSNAQANPASAVSHPKEEPPKDFSLKVAVEEVRIDAVVLDRKGHQITDLTADDFELYQDGKLQKITSCAYVNEYQAMSRDSSKAGLRVSAPMLPRDRVRRTIAFIVDDLSMDAYEHFLYTRMALQKFVESQMQPGDLVVIFQSSGGALLQFSSDKRQLLSTIKNLRWKGGRGGMIGCGPDGCGTAAIAVGASPDFNSAVDAQYTSDALKRQAWINRGRFLPGPQGASEEAYADYRRRLLESQIAILRYCLRTVRDMPGRKSILFMSSVITFPEVSFGKLGQSTPYAAFKSLDQDSIYLNIRQLFDKVADEALRAGAVIFTLDMKGLEVDKNVGSNETYIPVSKKTGGIIIEDSNFFLGGIGPAEEELKGYYLLSFIPPTNTFDENRRGSYRHIQVKVKRHGNKVRSRDGYFGTAHPPDLASTTEKNTLQQAIFSPFLYSDLRLSLASGYAYTPAPGYFLRS